MNIGKKVSDFEVSSKNEEVRSTVREVRSLEPSFHFSYSILLSTLYLLLFSCSTKFENNQADTSPKFKQYYYQGEQLYLKNCSNCHQKDGTGLGLLYPPLNQSDYMDENVENVLCLVRYGKEGELIVNGKKFNQPMPGIPSLSDLEIAEISTYIYNTWDHKHGIIDVKEASKILQSCQPSK
jgi:mono/diheme cytochrome c family protein